jgi:signal transduction histidine kinase
VGAAAAWVVSAVTAGAGACGGRVGRERLRLALAVGVAVLCWTLVLGGLAVAVASGVAGRVSWPNVVIAVAYPAVALLVVRARAAGAWAALMLLSGVYSGLNVAGGVWADRAYVAHRQPTPGADWAAWVSSWTWVVSLVAMVCALAFFPDGRLPSRRWWPVPAAVLAAGVVLVVGASTNPTVEGYGVPNPLPVPHVGHEGGVPAGLSLLALAGWLGSLAAVVVRFRRADGVVRRQIGWYAYGNAVFVALLVVASVADLPALVLALAPAAVAVSAAIAVLRYRLYDIDVIVNRTLAWAVLTGLVVALYVICVGFFQRIFAGGGGTAGALLATGVVAVAFQPLRERVQRAVNQLVYGYRDQPEVVLRALARTFDAAAAPEEVLPSLAGTLARTLRLAAVVLEVDTGGGGVAYGATDRTDLVEAARAHSGGTLVRVWVAPRRSGGVVNARDRQLLADVAPSLAATAEALRLQRALEAARLRAVAALAEEQRRMRRDLHDGLGPVLAGLRLTIGTARRLIERDPAGADRLLADAQHDALVAVDDVRRLAYDLRPPALDDLGLVAALRDRLERLVDQQCRLDFTADEVPDRLPAAVEVAAYRIGCEAVLNVARHARAHRCQVRLLLDRDALLLTVADDGVGMAPGAGGVGLRSLRERVEELGGAVRIEGTPGVGTTVQARLPLTGPDGSQP